MDELTGGMTEEEAGDMLAQIADALPNMEMERVEASFRKAVAANPYPQSISDGLDRIRKVVQQDLL